MDEQDNIFDKDDRLYKANEELKKCKRDVRDRIEGYIESDDVPYTTNVAEKAASEAMPVQNFTIMDLASLPEVYGCTDISSSEKKKANGLLTLAKKYIYAVLKSEAYRILREKGLI